MASLLLLGTGGSGPPPGRAENCFLLDTGDARLLLDAGPGCPQRLIEAGYSVCDVDLVYLTHLHVDHWAGLFDAAVYMEETGCGRPPAIAVAEPLAQEARRLQSMLPSVFRGTVVLPVPVTGGWKLGVLLLEPVESRHSVPAYGVVVSYEGSRLLYYSGDTAPTEATRRAAQGVEAALIEATMPTGMEEVAEKTGHHTVEQALSYADGKRTLATVHLSMQSLRELLERVRTGRLPSRVLVPADHTVLTL